MGGTNAATPLPPSAARRYTLLRRIAVGGMGELLLARASAPGGVQKLVAIKRVRAEYASDEAFVSMFLNEARLAATLDHPNVVRTYDLVEDEGTFFMVMEYLHGESLGRVLNAAVKLEARVPLSHVVTIALGVAAGLHCAHERRGVDGRPLDIVHRDLSPGNVFLTYEGGVKLLDFGIAKATSRTAITIGPSRKGKVSYMSPEQTVGQNVDRRSDIFALGVVMWELCTGRRLFTGDNEFAIMNQITTTDAPLASEHADDLPPELVEILARALARDREHRFQTAMELHEAVEAVASTHGLLPSSPALGRYVQEACGRKEFPSVEPTAEFRDKDQTLVAGGHEAASKPRRLSLVLALVGGATLGAVAVGATSTDPAPAAAPPVAEERLPVDIAPAATDRSAKEPAVAEPADGAGDPRIAEQTDAAKRLERAADLAAVPSGTKSATDDPAEPAPPPKARAKRKKKKRKKGGGEKPREPTRGVNGLLPRG